ncbi:hypothetical protein R3P38DRAFT_3437861, partial [Favolaschia claudopus]
PSQNFPVEIVQTVFCASLSEQKYCDPRSADEPLLLAAVCSQWRTIATTTRDLWSSLNFQASCSRKHGTELLLLWLERSGTRPFSLRLALA